MVNYNDIQSSIIGDLAFSKEELEELKIARKMLSQRVHSLACSFIDLAYLSKNSVNLSLRLS